MPKTPPRSGSFFKAFARTRRIFFWILLVLILLCIIVWCMDNRQLVQISFMPFSYGLEMPLFLLVLIAFTLAYAVAIFQSFLHTLQLKRRIKLLHSRLHAMETLQHQQQLSERLKTETLRDAETDAEPLWQEASTPMIEPAPLPQH